MDYYHISAQELGKGDVYKRQDQDESSIPGTEESHLESGLSGVPLCPQVSMIVPG